MVPTLFWILFVCWSIIDFEFLDQLREILASLEGDDELSLLSSSWALFLSSWCKSKSLDFLDRGVAVSAQRFSDFNASGDGVAQAVKFNGLEVQKEKFGDEYIESGVFLG